MSMYRVFSCVVGKGCLLWPVHFLGKTLLVFALLHSAFRGKICLLLQVFLDFLLLHSSPLWWKGHLFGVLVLEGLIGLHRTVQLQLQHYWLGHKLGLLWYWRVCLGNEQRSLCCFWDCIQVLHIRLFFFFFFYYDGSYLSSELNSPIPVHFSSLIPKMLMFTLSIFCLTTSNLPWFIDLTFQVPMQYCYLQHQTLLSSPVISTTGCCFCFGFVSSFVLGLFLHWSPIAYWKRYTHLNAQV